MKALTCIAISLLFSASVLAADASHLYVTWRGVEPDKAASAWYIKRYVDREAVFEMQAPGSHVARGIAFDTPFARFRRIHNASTFETLLREHPSSDPVVQRIALITRDIEINLWQPKRFPESVVIDSRLKEVAARHAEGDVPIACLIAFFDHVYEWLASADRDEASLRAPAVCEQGRKG
jgi:hypothetical protein